ncbi:MAG: hypothetical protein WC455_11335 [Dehalococcoidia bacterium]|jgi:hypothetical protein
MITDDLTPQTEPVKLSGKDYSLREASGDAATKFANARLSCIKLGPDGKPQTVRGIADVEPLLVSLCLFDESGKNVPEATVRSWPARVQKVLYDRAKEMSHLDDLETEAAIVVQITALQKRLEEMRESKNVGSESTADGSD